MNPFRRCLIAATLGLPLLLAGCAARAPAVDLAVARVLAPTGTLRVGVYPGSPSSLVVNPKTGERAGVALELGQALGKQLGVPVQVVEFGRLPLVLDALKTGTVDFAFTNATEARAKDMAFTPPLIQLELGYLVPPGSAIATVADVDRAANRVGVTEGSSSQGVLTRTYKQAVVVPVASIKLGQEMLKQGKLDAFATNKGILFEMSDDLARFPRARRPLGPGEPGHRHSQGARGRMPFVSQFAQDVRASGQLQAIITRAGLRGVARSD